MKINWKQKLSSRKFQGMILALIILTAALFTSDNPVVQGLSIIGVIADILCYIAGESYVDGAREYAKVEKDLQYCQKTIDAIAKRVNEMEEKQQWRT